MAAAFVACLPPAQKLVLLKICDCANDRGLNAYPAMKTIAAAASVSERQAQRLVGELRRLDWVSVQMAPSRYRPTTYRVNVERLMAAQRAAESMGDTDDTPGALDDDVRGDTYVTPETSLMGDVDVTPNESRGDTDDVSGVTSEVVRGDTGDVSGVTPMSPDPSGIRQDPSGIRETRARGAGGSLIGRFQDGHARHEFCDPTLSRCVPAWLHRQLRDRLAPAFEGDRDAAGQALKAWYPEVVATLAPADVIPDPPKFYQARFDERWASVPARSVVAPSHRLLPRPPNPEVAAAQLAASRDRFERERAWEAAADAELATWPAELREALYARVRRETRERLPFCPELTAAQVQSGARSHLRGQRAPSVEEAGRRLRAELEAGVTS